jgi:hypothetical protein
LERLTIKKFLQRYNIFFFSRNNFFYSRIENRPQGQNNDRLAAACRDGARHVSTATLRKHCGDIAAAIAETGHRGDVACNVSTAAIATTGIRRQGSSTLNYQLSIINYQLSIINHPHSSPICNNSVMKIKPPCRTFAKNLNE